MGLRNVQGVIKMKARFYLLFFLILSPFAFSNAFGSEVPKDLLPILQEKNEIALNFSQIVADSVSRKDTNHPAFHGCIDWHSSVHGIWSLIAYMRATKDPRYNLLVKRILDSEKIEEERKYLKTHHSFEMPYGRAWFLRLAIEHRHYYQSDSLRLFGDQVAESMMTYFKNSPPIPHSRSYQSSSWALINLLDYGFDTRNIQIVDFVSKLIRDYFVNSKGSCLDTESDPCFMAVCTNVAWLISKELTRDDFLEWLKARRDSILRLQPIKEPRSAHEFGKNFSRAWGLWEIYSKTGEIEFAKSYATHFSASYSKESHWKGEYRIVGHWVPQFGMFALQPLFGPNLR